MASHYPIAEKQVQKESTASNVTKNIFRIEKEGRQKFFKARLGGIGGSGPTISLEQSPRV
jgi:hypothetical protein